MKKIKNFLADHSLIITAILVLGFGIWVTTWPSSKRHMEYVRWEWFSNDTTLVLTK